MKHYIRHLRQYAEHNPKASTAILVAGTALSCAAVVAFIEVRDRYKYDSRANGGRNLGSSASAAGEEITPREAQLAAMLETAKQSTWQENLRNAADAQDRFMLPGQNVDDGRDTPNYVKRIDERSGEILKEENDRRAREREKAKDPLNTRFW